MQASALGAVAVAGLAASWFATDASARTARLAGNTLLLAAAVAALAIPTGVLLAALVTRTDLPGRKACGWMLGGLIFVPLYVQAAAWQAGFGDSGWFTLAQGTSPLLAGWRGAITVHAAAAVPWVFLLMAAAFSETPSELEEAALLDAEPWRVFCRVTLRESSGAIAAATLWVLMIVAREMSVTDVFKVRTFAEEVFTDAITGGEPGQPPLAFTSSLLWQACLILPACWLVARFSRLGWTAGYRPSARIALGRWRWPAAIVAGLLAAPLVVVPLANLIWKTGVIVTQTPAGRVREWSLAKFATVFSATPYRYRWPIGWSLSVGAIAATLAVATALILVWHSRRGGWRRAPAAVAAVVALTLPAPLVGVWLIEIFNRPVLDFLYNNSIALLCVAQWLAALPLTLLVLWPALRRLPQALVDGAAVEGAGPMAIVTRVIAPQEGRALAVAWTVALAVAMAELGASFLVAPPGVDPLSVHILNLLHNGVEDQVTSICLLLFLTFPLLGLFAGRWLTAR